MAGYDIAEIRRGLPRTPGGEPWPPAEFAPARAALNTAVELEPMVIEAADVRAAVPQLTTSAEESPRHDPQPAPAAAQPTAAVAEVVADPAADPAAGPSASRLGRLAKRIVGVMLGAVAAAGIIVLAARGVTTLPGASEFLAHYPGEYALPEGTEAGFPAWARWTHFLNFFFMVLVVRSGLLVRRQQQPPALYTPKRGGKKVSIYLWLHTSLDVLWLLNGLVFVALLFATGHWVRIVPTSWEVLPNAASAMLQYLTLEWPTENGWVAYNSLQQLMYFLVVFIAAPLAAITGARMSEWWPKNATALNRAYPAPLARAIHYPTMLFFVLFVIVHVFLVFATGALRNLNHMFAGQDAVNWTGFWMFALGLAMTFAAVAAARPLVLAPLASVTGRVSRR